LCGRSLYRRRSSWEQGEYFAASTSPLTLPGVNATITTQKRALRSCRPGEISADTRHAKSMWPPRTGEGDASRYFARLTWKAPPDLCPAPIRCLSFQTLRNALIPQTTSARRWSSVVLNPVQHSPACHLQAPRMPCHPSSAASPTSLLRCRGTLSRERPLQCSVDKGVCVIQRWHLRLCPTA
jgi:hypothetical protein